MNDAAKDLKRPKAALLEFIEKIEVFLLDRS
jgi:hypothetical protein